MSQLQVLIKKVSITGIPGQTIELTGQKLFEALRVKYGDVVLNSNGVRLI